MAFNAGAITGTISLSTAPLTGAVARAKALMGELKNSTTSAFSAVSGLALKFAAIGGAIAGVGSIAGTFALGVKLAADAEQAQVAFSTMLGSADAAKTLLADLNQFAASTPFEMPGLTDAARKLIAFGSASDQVIPELRAIGDIASGTGQDISELAEIYGKARVQGRLMAEDVNQLTGRGIPIIQQFAKQFGVAESQVKKLVETGQINFGHLQQAFVDLSKEGGQFGGMMAAQSQTLTGMLSTLRDSFGLLARDLTADIFERVNIKGFIADVTAAIPIIKDVLGAAITYVSDLLGSMVERFSAAGNAGAESGNRVVAGMGIAAQGIASVADWLELGKAAFHGLQAVGTFAIYGLIKAVDFLGSTWVKLLNLVPGVELEWTETLGMMADEAWRTAEESASKAGDAFKRFFNEENSRAAIDELAEARKLLEQIDAQTKIKAALESIKTPTETFGEQMKQFQEWLDAGSISQGQFDRLNDKARKDAFGGDKLPGLIRSGSAEAQALAYDQKRASGSSGENRDPQRQTVNEQKKTNKHMEDLVQLIRQLQPSQRVQLIGL